MKYKPGDIVRRIDHYYDRDKANPARIAHYLVISEDKSYDTLGIDYTVFHLESNEILNLFLKNTSTMKHKKVA